MTWTLTLAALDADDNPQTLRFSLGRFDAPDNAFYDPRMKQPGLYEAGMYAGQLLRQSRSGHGQTTLENSDGALNYLADYAVDGREIVLALNDVVQVRGTVARLTFSGTEVAVVLRDPLEPLNTAHPMQFYAGSNVLPGGLEGTEDDIAGEPKPQVWGSVRNAAPVLVNSSLLIYQISSLSDCAISAVYDRGAALSDGGAYATLAALQATAPAPGQFRSFEGYARLGDSPVGAVTVDAAQADPRLGSVAAAITAERRYTLHAPDIAALNNYGAVRVFLNAETNTLAMLDQLAESVGGYLSMQPDATLRLAELTAPTANENYINDYSISTIARSSAGAGDNGLPVWRVTVEYDRIESVQTDLAGNVSDERRARVSQQYRKVQATAPGVRERHPLAGEITIQSALSDRAKAQAVASRVLALLSTRRDTLTIDALDALTPSIGGLATVVTPRLGYDEGRPMRVTGYRLNAETDELTINLWG